MENHRFYIMYEYTVYTYTRGAAMTVWVQQDLADIRRRDRIAFNRYNVDCRPAEWEAEAAAGQSKTHEPWWWW